jgi:hypothetical protein
MEKIFLCNVCRVPYTCYLLRVLRIPTQERRETRRDETNTTVSMLPMEDDRQEMLSQHNSSDEPMSKSPIYRMACQVSSKGKRVAASKRRVKWEFGFFGPDGTERGREHQVVLVWSLTGGKQVILADGHEVHFSRQTSLKIECTWKKWGHEMKVIAHAAPPIFPKADFRQFDFWIDGKSWNMLPTLNLISLDTTRANLPSLSTSAHTTSSRTTATTTTATTNTAVFKQAMEEEAPRRVPRRRSSKANIIFRRSQSMPVLQDHPMDGIFKFEPFTTATPPSSSSSSPQSNNNNNNMYSAGWAEDTTTTTTTHRSSHFTSKHSESVPDLLSMSHFAPSPSQYIQQPQQHQPPPIMMDHRADDFFSTPFASRSESVPNLLSWMDNSSSSTTTTTFTPPPNNKQTTTTTMNMSRTSSSPSFAAAQQQQQQQQRRPSSLRMVPRVESVPELTPLVVVMTMTTSPALLSSASRLVSSSFLDHNANDDTIGLEF